MASSTLFLLLTLYFYLATYSAAGIKTLTISNDDRPLILFEKFGFTPNRSVSISVSTVTFSSSLAQPDPALFGFFLLSDDYLLQAVSYRSQYLNPNNCFLFSPSIRLLFTFKNLTSQSFNNTFPIFIPDEYSLFFANCVPGSTVSMVVRTGISNFNNGQKDLGVVFE